jgi:hypothetical protein
MDEENQIHNNKMKSKIEKIGSARLNLVSDYLYVQ